MRVWLVSHPVPTNSDQVDCRHSACDIHGLPPCSGIPVCSGTLNRSERLVAVPMRA